MALTSCSPETDKTAIDPMVGKWEQRFALTKDPNGMLIWEFLPDGKLVIETRNKGNPDADPSFRMTGTFKRLDQNTVEFHYDKPWGGKVESKVTVQFQDEEMFLEFPNERPRTLKRLK
jgi:uncharacterized protein (TIGR03066 family)